jgi:prevent-host-death family protein
MGTKLVDSHQARNNWRELLDAVRSQGTDVVITRYNKPVVALLNYEDYLSIREELAKNRGQRQAQRQLQEEAIL